MCKEVSERVYEHAKKGELTVTLGGDHSLAMGTVSGTFRAFPEAALIWVDAHAVRKPISVFGARSSRCRY